jgi:hypothetical protein
MIGLSESDEIFPAKFSSTLSIFSFLIRRFDHLGTEHGSLPRPMSDLSLEDFLNELSAVVDGVLPPPRCLDPDTAKRLQDHRRNLERIRVARLTRNLSEFRWIWPDATPAQMFVAFSFCDDDAETAKGRLSDPAFRRAVCMEAEVRGFGQPPRPAWLPPVPREPRKPQERGDAKWAGAMADSGDPERRFAIAPRVGPRRAGNLKPISPVEADAEASEQTLTFLFQGRRYLVGWRYSASERAVLDQ